MRKISSEARKKLVLSPFVAKITKSHVSYTPEFKRQCVDAYDRKNCSAEEIFSSRGIDPTLFPKEYCRFAIQRWIKQRTAKGQITFSSENRGRPRGKKKTAEDLTTWSAAELRDYILIQEEFIENIKKLKASKK